jgi:hypothetical protein
MPHIPVSFDYRKWVGVARREDGYGTRVVGVGLFLEYLFAEQLDCTVRSRESRGLLNQCPTFRFVFGQFLEDLGHASFSERISMAMNAGSLR